MILLLQFADIETLKIIEQKYSYVKPDAKLHNLAVILGTSEKNQSLYYRPVIDFMHDGCLMQDRRP